MPPQRPRPVAEDPGLPPRRIGPNTVYRTQPGWGRPHFPATLVSSSLDTVWSRYNRSHQWLRPHSFAHEPREQRGAHGLRDSMPMVYENGSRHPLLLPSGLFSADSIAERPQKFGNLFSFLRFFHTLLRCCAMLFLVWLHGRSLFATSFFAARWASPEDQRREAECVENSP
jgi:hypothetical protein